MEKGKLITLEGGEGSGKSTQLEFVKNWFEKHNIPYMITREPGGTALGDDVRNILKHAKYQILPRAEILLFNACRAELIEEKIKPALNNGINVICDRFYDSSVAYQAFGRGLDASQVMDICMYATDQIEPDLTLWLDIKPAVAFARKHGADENDRMEQSGLEFHNNVYLGYKYLHENYPRIKRIDATKSIDEVSADIDTLLKQSFNI